MVEEKSISERRAAYSKSRRDLLRAQKLCINGTSHGLATHGVLCERCRMVHRGRSQPAGDP